MLRTNRFIVVCVLALSAALIALSGCGGDSQKDTYKKEAKKAGQDFKSSAQAASAKISAAPTREGKIAGLTGLKASVTKAADDFSKLDPPDDVKALNSTLVTELRALAGDVDQVQTALKGGNQAAAKAVVPKLQVDQGKIIGTISQIEQKVGK
jgi:hypothetical protein